MIRCARYPTGPPGAPSSIYCHCDIPKRPQTLSVQTDSVGAALPIPSIPIRLYGPPATDTTQTTFPTAAVLLAPYSSISSLPPTNITQVPQVGLWVNWFLARWTATTGLKIKAPNSGTPSQQPDLKHRKNSEAVSQIKKNDVAAHNTAIRQKSVQTALHQVGS